MPSLNVAVGFALLFVFFCSIQGVTTPAPHNLTKKVHMCIDSITKAVNFYTRRYKNLDVDSLHELAILRGWLKEFWF